MASPDFVEKTFAGGSQTMKFVKVFSLESFLLYSSKLNVQVCVGKDPQHTRVLVNASIQDYRSDAVLVHRVCVLESSSYYICSFAESLQARKDGAVEREERKQSKN